MDSVLVKSDGSRRQLTTCPRSAVVLDASSSVATFSFEWFVNESLD
jgi:hypothetical protein